MRPMRRMRQERTVPRLSNHPSYAASPHPMSYAQIGQRLGISGVRVQQIHAKIIAKFKRALKVR